MLSILREWQHRIDHDINSSTLFVTQGCDAGIGGLFDTSVLQR